MTALGDAALAYAARGWPVFPLCGIQLGWPTCARRRCPHPGKHPLTSHGLDDATTDPAQIRAWWRQWPAANIAIRTGEGLTVLDVEDHRALEGIPVSPTVSTGRGQHVYFISPAPVSNKVATSLRVDVRGERGYVIAPPSHHANGSTYRWRVPLEIPLATCPPWIVRAVGHGLTRDSAPFGNTPAHSGRETPPLDATPIPEGRRVDTLWRLGRRCKLKGWSAESIARKLIKVNALQCQPPLDEPEITRLVRRVQTTPDRPEYRRAGGFSIINAGSFPKGTEPTTEQPQ